MRLEFDRANVFSSEPAASGICNRTSLC